VPRKVRSDDEIFKAAKNKLGDLIQKSADPKEVMGLVNTLVKMKAVELKMSDEDWGGNLNAPKDDDEE